MTIIQLIEIFIISLANAVGQVFLKKAELKTFGWEMFSNKFVWVGALIYVAAFWFWVKIINQAEMSAAIPIFTSIVYVFTIIFAWYFFKEQITVFKILGTFLILLGIFFLVKK
jgi:multidrug transporter EmrE-like cation transporter